MSDFFDHRICRVLIRDDGTVHILCVGGNSQDAPDVDDIYTDVDSLPEWVLDKLSVLSITDPTPPTKNIEGVGRRINKNTFWIDVNGTMPNSVNFNIGNINNLTSDSGSATLVLWCDYHESSARHDNDPHPDRTVNPRFYYRNRAELAQQLKE
jgi:hypothetical protein